MHHSTVLSPIDASLRKLVSEHRKIKDEPLLLAAHYVPARATKDICLFEIASGFGVETVDPDRTMFEVSYGSATGLPLEPDQDLRLLLTNPTEWKVAVRQKWPAVRALRDAISKGHVQVLYQTPKGAELWRMIGG